MSAEAMVSKGLMDTGESASKLTHMAVSGSPQVLAGCWLDALDPHHVDVSIGFLESPYNMSAGSPWGE